MSPRQMLLRVLEGSMVYRKTEQIRCTILLLILRQNCYTSCLQSAVGWDYQEKLAQHTSQSDGSKGFGGKYGVQKDRVDEVRVGLLI